MIYVLYQIIFFAIVPVALVLTRRARVTWGVMAGGLVFWVIEAAWWGRVAYLWDVDPALAGRWTFTGWHVGDLFLLVGVYLSAALGIQWLAGDEDGD